ncbi:MULTISPECIES: transposase [Gluconobacter]|uniref:transposase n=1 Tax=Gluconobacter TaxID=441 RepID=UPI0039EB0B08
MFLNGILYVLRVGCPWRDMHERHRKWNSVYVRVRRWAEQGGGCKRGPHREGFGRSRGALRARSTPILTVRDALLTSI